MIAEFHYAVPWRGNGAQPGVHPSTQAGGSYEFAGHVSLLNSPDPRKIDLRASLGDPYQRLLVREFRQRSSIPVTVLADLSASLAFGGPLGKPNLIAQVCAAVAYSAYRSGDPFGLFAATDRINWNLSLPLRFHKSAGPEIMDRLRGFIPNGRSAEGLADIAPVIGKSRALVFLLSDFHGEDAWLERIFTSLARHDVVPVVIWSHQEYAQLPRYGIAELRDPETGQRRRVWLRPKLHAAWADWFEKRREDLTRRCRQWGRDPFFVIDRFDADAMTRYFL